MDSSSLPSGVHSLRSFTEYGGVETWALNPLLVAFKLLFGFRSVFLTELGSASQDRSKVKTKQNENHR